MSFPRRILWVMRRPPYREAPAKHLLRAVQHMKKERTTPPGGVITFSACQGRKFESPRNNFPSFVAATFDERDVNITKFWSTALKTGGTFFDVGANIGLYCISANRHIGPSGKAVAFEAHPTIYGFLERNVRNNSIKNITAENLAVGAEAGTIRMAFNSRNPGETHVSEAEENGSASRPVKEPGGEVTVPMVSLDSYCAEHGIDHIDYLKLDVEGYETHVLRGAESVIAASDSILIQTEFEPQHLQRYGDSSELINLLKSWGFMPHTIAWADGAPSALESFNGYHGEIIWSRVSLAK